MSLGPQMAKIRVNNQKGFDFNTGPYGDSPHPLKNQNFENQASLCFKLAKIKPRAKI